MRHWSLIEKGLAQFDKVSGVALEHKLPPSCSHGLKVDQVPDSGSPSVLCDEPVGGGLVKLLRAVEEKYDRRLIRTVTRKSHKRNICTCMWMAPCNISRKSPNMIVQPKQRPWILHTLS